MRVAKVVRLKRLRRLVQLTEIWVVYCAWLELVKATKKRKSPVVWMYDYLRTRHQNSQCFNVVRLLQNPASIGHARIFKNAFGVDVEMFRYLCERVGPLIERQDTNWRPCISVEERMEVTLLYLTGYVVAVPSVSKIVAETCLAIIEVFHDEVMLTPSTEQDWRDISQRFQERWNMPHALGAIDGKHIRIRKPANSGSAYFNYKKFFSIILFAMVDANLEFRYVEIGEPGRSSDGTIFNESNLLQGLNDNKLNIPKDEVLEGDSVTTPYFILSDAAFALRTWMQKPYPGSHLQRDERIYNYRLSRARLVVECAFGILASR